MDAILPIYPEHAKRILDGSKTMEFRRKRLLRIEPGSRFVLYATAPVQALVGSVRVSLIVEAAPEQIIAYAAERGDVRPDRIDYLRGNRAVCYHLEKPVRFEHHIQQKDIAISFSTQGPTYVTEHVLRNG